MVRGAVVGGPGDSRRHLEPAGASVEIKLWLHADSSPRQGARGGGAACGAGQGAAEAEETVFGMISSRRAERKMQSCAHRGFEADSTGYGETSQSAILWLMWSGLCKVAAVWRMAMVASACDSGS